MLQCRNATSNATSNDEHLHIKNYCLFKTIGRGSFGTVMLAQEMQSKLQVAIKIVDLTRLDSARLETVCREVNFLRSLNHPNIVKLYEAIETKKVLYLVMEYVSGGDLYHHFQSERRLQEDEARLLFRQTVCAVQYIHQMNVAHKDLKPSNLLLDENRTVKVADFGLSEAFQIGKDLETPGGAVVYRAPEVLQGASYNGPKADTWSLGVTLYKLLTGSRPFSARTAEKIMKDRWLNTGYENDLLKPYADPAPLSMGLNNTGKENPDKTRDTAEDTGVTNSDSALPFGSDYMYRPPELKKLKRLHFRVHRVVESVPMAEKPSSDCQPETSNQMHENPCEMLQSSEDNHNPEKTISQGACTKEAEWR
ncbi:serine/threonine-protein kinase MARK2-like [Bombina bombina]|uniref:serine/threonine-protein kinase MARK2-like n=1 Tax=Bombina bombina TaxID=8345 RepID=UPI00235B12DF|nr:serine/threonine-protein kinase MARK2-like [Bombina bombina]